MTDKDVEDEHQRLGCKLGWRVLYSPKKTLETARVAFITLNPGGGKPEKNSWSFEEGNAYQNECWNGKVAGKSPLQFQVTELFSALGLKAEEVLSGVLVPFRSPNWKELPNRKEALAFGEKLWSHFLDGKNIKLLLVMSRLVENSIVRITDMGPKKKEFPTGWGNINFRVYEKMGRKIISIPHLSRFTLFSEVYRDDTRKFMSKFKVSRSHV